MVQVNDEYRLTIRYPEHRGFIILSHGILRNLIDYFGVKGSIESHQKDTFEVSSDGTIIYEAACTDTSKIDVARIFTAFSEIKGPIKDLRTLDLSTENLTGFPAEEEYDTCYCSGE